MAEAVRDTAFTTFHRPALELEPAKHSLILSMFSDPSTMTCWDLGEPGECAVMSPGRPILLADLSQQQCHWVAELTSPITYAGVIGPKLTTSWFIGRAQELGLQFVEIEKMLIWSIDGAPHYPGSSGHSRVATTEDLPLLQAWMPAFQAEANPYDPLPSKTEILRGARDGHITLWVDQGEPVAMAGICRWLRTAASITGVYTPPELRGHGYAGSVTAAAVGRIYAEGRDLVSLYTNMADPAANRCYEKIGFEKVCEAQNWQRLLTMAPSPDPDAAPSAG